MHLRLKDLALGNGVRLQRSGGEERPHGSRPWGPATEMMLDHAGVKTGSRVLDVGAGAGDSTRRRFQSLSDAMQFARGPLPLRELMIRLTPSEQGQAWTEIERALTQFVGPNGYDSPCEVLIGVGVK